MSTGLIVTIHDARVAPCRREYTPLSQGCTPKASADILGHRLQEERAFWTELVRDSNDNPFRRKSPRMAGLLKMHEELVRLLDAQNVGPNLLLICPLFSMQYLGSCTPWAQPKHGTLGAIHL